MNKGLVVKSISGEYTVYDNGNYIVCKPRGLFRHKDETIKVGDKVEYDLETKTIISYEKRINDLVRPVCANVIKGFVVTSVVEPDLNLNLLDKMICQLEYNNIKPIIVFTKVDLLKDQYKTKHQTIENHKYNEYIKIKEYYKKIGYTIIDTDEEHLIDNVINYIGEDVCVMTGQSGVGKSTLLNRINKDLDLKTNEISKALGRGKHTTRHIELFPVGKGFLGDSPGFGNLSLESFTEVAISHAFIEFLEHSENCKFKPCLHINEPNCKVKELVKDGTILKSRYDNYLQFISEYKKLKRY